MPKGNDSHIQVQFISLVSAVCSVAQSKPRYIHHKMAAPKATESRNFSIESNLFNSFL